MYNNADQIIFFVIWNVISFLIIGTVFLLTGKGIKIISVFNKKLENEQIYNKVKVSRRAGIYMLFIDIGILALGVYLQFRIIPLIKNGLTGMYGKEIAIAISCICLYIAVAIVIGVVSGFKKCKK